MESLAIADACIYTTRFRHLLEKASRERKPFVENKPWVTGKKLFDEARAEGKRLALVCSDASTTSDLIGCALIDRISLRESGTHVTISSWTPLRGHVIQDLVLHKHSRQIAPNFIKPYAICRTPQFVVDALTTSDAGTDAFDGIEQLEGVEGRRRVEQHVGRERVSGLRDAALRARRRLVGNLSCEACGFDFEVAYGDLGTDFAEVHHAFPLSAREAHGSATRVEDLRVVCANCHRMIHHRYPWLDLNQLTRVLADARRNRAPLPPLEIDQT